MTRRSSATSPLAEFDLSQRSRTPAPRIDERRRRIARALESQRHQDDSRSADGVHRAPALLRMQDPFTQQTYELRLRRSGLHVADLTQLYLAHYLNLVPLPTIIQEEIVPVVSLRLRFRLAFDREPTPRSGPDPANDRS